MCAHFPASLRVRSGARAPYSLRRVITGDLDASLAAPVSSAGTWRPAPSGAGGAPGTYATTIAFLLASDCAKDPAGIAAVLAARLRGLDWVAGATVTGGGYLTVTVTAEALGWLAVRVTKAGLGCARSDALAGTALTVPVAVDLASAVTWEEARRDLTATVTGRLAEAAGADIRWTHDAERMDAPHSPHPDTARSATGRPPGPPAPGEPGSAQGRPPGQGPVAEAVAFAGADAVIWVLARLRPQRPARIDARLAAAHDLGNPAYAVRYAHAHAASTLRQAANLGLTRGEAAEFQPRLLDHPSEQALLYELSWLPERVAGAARRRRPDVLARFLEKLAGAYLDCQESCPAAWPVPGEPATSQASGARLWLAEAARTALCAGLGLFGVEAPDWL